MAFLDFLLGKKQKTESFQRFNPAQESVLNQLLGGAAQQLPGGLDFLSSILSQSPEAQAQFEAPALTQFSEEILPTIAERFTGMFGPGAQKSAAFGQQLGKAGANLAERLQAQRSGLGFDALSQLQNLLGAGLQPRSDTVVRPGTPGFLQGFLGNVAQPLGHGIGQRLGGGLGSLLGL